ncbi:MAG TPA: ATP-binding protein [Candidatus Bathyarchaeota archaeon]|nr:ATP-binding protein [Candidatus Bathyarchaeota archaeon]
MSNTPKEIGTIVSEASPSEFYFSTEPEQMPQRWEYVMVYSEEISGGTIRRVPVIAQVEGITSISQALSRDVDFEIIKKLVESGLVDTKVWCRAKVLGFLAEDGNVLQPRRAVTPGKSVYIATPEILKKFYSYPEEEAIHIGSLITRLEVPVHLSIKGFRRHLAIIAQTGAGKSYLAGILAIELLKKGGTIVMLDPHADYVFLSKDTEGKPHKLTDRITVFKNPMSTGRYSEAEVPNLRSYEVSFAELDLDEICMIARISERYTNIRAGLEIALNITKQSKRCFLPKDILKELENADSWEDVDKKIKAGAKSAVKYIKRLAGMRVFSSVSTSIENFLKPMHLSVIDLSGLEDEIADYIAYRILTGIYEKISGGEFEYPVFIFIEEAHRFIPSNGETYSSPIIKRIAAEGRKFGIFLIVITQRPSKIHPDVLSQCNSQIIMRITNPNDQNAVSKSSERMSRDLLEDLPGLNVGEAVIVGEMTRAPVMVKVKRRTTMEGGADIDIIGKLSKAVEEAKKETAQSEAERLRNELKDLMREFG